MDIRNFFNKKPRLQVEEETEKEPPSLTQVEAEDPRRIPSTSKNISSTTIEFPGYIA